MIAGAKMPDFIEAEDRGAGTEGLGKIIRPPRVKIMQSNRGSNFKQFKEGSVILSPAGVELAEVGQPFWFVPLLYYPEYLTTNPWKLKATLPMVRARSLDPESEIAQKSRDKDRRKADPCPEDSKEFLTHQEVFTFICLIMGQAPIPTVLSFARAEHGKGRNLAQLIMMRNPAPLYACVFEGVVPETQRKNDQGQWYGLDVTNPQSDGAPSQWIENAEEYRELKKVHLALVEDLKNQLIEVDYEEDVDDEVVTPPSSAAASM
jgi:hypothetical protein